MNSLITTMACPVCKNLSSRKFTEFEDAGRTVRYAICNHCGFVFQNPMPSQEQFNDYYAQQYRSERLIPIEITSKNKRRAQHLGAFIKDHIHWKTPLHHLDIGSGTGGLIQYLKTEFAFQSEGVEPDIGCRDYCKTLNLVVYPSIEEWQQRNKPVDLITLVHVLEHIPDPVSYLRNLRECALSKTGWLLIEVPNLYGHETFTFDHPLAFSDKTLRATVESAGFKVETLEIHGRPFRRGRLYITLIATPQNTHDNEISIDDVSVPLVFIRRVWGRLPIHIEQALADLPILGRLGSLLRRMWG
jgi:hypothetical protein